jgi:hypothetical protein
MTTRIGLEPERDLEIALLTAAETNRVIAGADAKAGLVLAAQGVVLAGIASAMRAGPQLPGFAQVLAVGATVLAGIAVLLLVGSLWPRMHGSASAWFAVPVLGRESVPACRPDTTQLAEQAWAQAGALAEIARRKYRWFRAALVVASTGLVAFTAWIALLGSD